ncbi:mersacidin/lichenicidin family type 2 lantibiotic [Archangium lansingense]|uniref:Mersacidin/lichenicidin family type 2 lantibiotic n=1 Tax=Archangium lansingense TaxID=2995310 RepID=A0ABT4A0W0_9BACT|nr:mersacidin/lichenicidin family type 2 lantibiotic [Archangium lansinium]MCY1074634.1 mersacidin/lichenicidin family type 2 lantibiotic [Archangium lansinium]
MVRRDGHATIIRAWKDPRFRASLTSEQRDSLPEGTCGKSMAELSEEDCQGITGGALLLNPQVLQLNRPILAKTECVCTHHCGLTNLTEAVYPSPGGLPPRF